MLKNILITAFNIDPSTGGESGMAWNFVHQVSLKHKVILITQKSNADKIKKHLKISPGVSSNNIRILNFDLPKRYSSLLKHSALSYVYYFIWQIKIPKFIENANLKFDIVHNLSMNKDWTPSFLYKLKKPFVWGPIGHRPEIPANYIKYVYGSKSYFVERTKWTIKKIMWRYNPWLSKTVQNADRILVMNSKVEEVLSLDKNQVTLMPGFANNPARDINKNYNGIFKVVSVGKFEPLSGLDIAVKAFANFYHRLPDSQKQNTTFTLIGEGEYKGYLQQIVHDLKLGEVVKFESWLHPQSLRQLFIENLVMLSPTHELKMPNLSEAFSSGLPLICFENCGPGSLVDDSSGITLPYQNYRDTILEFSNSLRRLFEDRVTLENLSIGAQKKFAIFFDGNVNEEQIVNMYDQLRPTAQ